MFFSPNCKIDFPIRKVTFFPFQDRYRIQPITFDPDREVRKGCITCLWGAEQSEGISFVHFKK